MRVFSPWLALLAVLPGPALALSPCEVDGADQRLRAYMIDYYAEHYFARDRARAEANMWVTTEDYALLGSAAGRLDCQATITVRVAIPDQPRDVGGARGALRFAVDPTGRDWRIAEPDGALWEALPIFHRDYF